MGGIIFAHLHAATDNQKRRNPPDLERLQQPGAVIVAAKILARPGLPAPQPEGAAGQRLFMLCHKRAGFEDGRQAEHR